MRPRLSNLARASGYRPGDGPRIVAGIAAWGGLYIATFAIVSMLLSATL